MSVMYQHVQGKARPPREINQALPPGLPEVIMQAMSVDKDKRYQTMQELRAALEKFRELRHAAASPARRGEDHSALFAAGSVARVPARVESRTASHLAPFSPSHAWVRPD